MSLIRNVKYIPSKKENAQPVILLCGFGGAIWQTRRLIAALTGAGYNVTALDFSKKVLSSGDPVLLPQLVDEVVTFVEKEADKHSGKVLLVGISLGSLLSLNIFRRSAKFDQAVMLTGGNIVTVAKNLYGDKIWPQSHEELSRLWQGVNIFTEPNLLKHKRALFVLPLKDTLIDTSEVLTEIARQKEAGNAVRLIKRGSFGHAGTIIEETILFPRRVLGYIDTLQNE